jgi:hypothetical protein
VFASVHADAALSKVLGNKWPQIRKAEATFGISTNADHIEFELPILDVNGIERYTFWCVGGSTNYLYKRGEADRETYVAPLACFLNEGKAKGTYSLLGEDGAPHWHTRAQIRDEDLTGKCGDYPEFGRERHFRLRNFELTIRFTEIAQSKSGDVEYFKLAVSVRPDNRYGGGNAARPDYLDPHVEGRSCAVILRGHDPKMCRIDRNVPERGSWEVCRK